jgi:hypothetical protein
MLHARGGWFIRTLGIRESDVPLTFRSYCGPGREERMNVFKDLEIRKIQRSQIEGPRRSP